MTPQIYVHPTMLKIIQAILPRRLKRSDLIAEAMKFHNYRQKEKAESYISRQVHRLNKLNLIVPWGVKNSRWYEPTQEMRSILDRATFDIATSKESVLAELQKDESKLELEILLTLSERSEMKALSERFPTLIVDIDPIISNGNKRIAELYGKLNAVKNLKKIVGKFNING